MLLLLHSSLRISRRVLARFRSKPLASYQASFRLSLALMVYLEIQEIDSVQAVSLFVEYLAQQGLRAQIITNYVSVLQHYFAVFNLCSASLDHRLIHMAIRAVAYNAPVAVKVKGVLTITNLKDLRQAAEHLPDPPVYKAVMLLGSVGFYRLSTLVPSSVAPFSSGGFPTHGDIIWGPLGAHLVFKCTKSMQVSGQVQVSQIPQLQDQLICPVATLKRIVSTKAMHVNKPLFTVMVGNKTTILTAGKVRRVLSSCITSIGLRPSEFGFHSFCRSGACWAFDHNFDLDKIKTRAAW